MSDPSAQLKRWENGLNKWDLTEETRKANDFLEDYGRDRFSYKPETLILRNEYARKNEAMFSHGYPVTGWLQLSIAFGCGVYTAQEQGILGRRQAFGAFWRHHYFDWILAAKRATIFGLGGGLVAGTLLFGDKKLAWARVKAAYDNYLADPGTDPRANLNTWHIKL